MLHASSKMLASCDPVREQKKNTEQILILWCLDKHIGENNGSYLTVPCERLPTRHLLLHSWFVSVKMCELNELLNPWLRCSRRQTAIADLPISVRSTERQLCWMIGFLWCKLTDDKWFLRNCATDRTISRAFKIINGCRNIQEGLA